MYNRVTEIWFKLNHLPHEFTSIHEILKFIFFTSETYVSAYYVIMYKVYCITINRL